MRIGVMGASGFVGSHLIQDLGKLNNVKGFSSSFSDDLKGIQQGDYSNPSHVSLFCQDLDAVIYAAGTVDPRFSQNDQFDELKKTLMFQLELAVTSFFDANPNGKFIFLSSAGAIYPKSFFKIHNEESDLTPIGFYGDLKLSQEVFLKSKFQDKDVIVLRPSNIFGDPYKKNTKTGIVDRLIFSSLKKETINIFENLKNERDYLFIDDLVDAVSLILKFENFQSNSGFRVFNLSSHSSTTLEKIISDVSSIFGEPTLIFSNENFEPNALKISSDKFRNVTGWKPKYNLEKALIFLKKKMGDK